MARYRRHPGLRLAALEGEGVVLHLGSRRYFSVNETGLVILEALGSARTVEELVSDLCARYDVSAEHAETTVRGFLARCRETDVLLTDET
jgi:hypothetical protein